MQKRKTGSEHLVFAGMPTGYLLSDFWAWHSSNLLDNTLRGSYCEFVVSAALGIGHDGVNEDWTPYDILLHHNGSEIRIEVKSAAYLQAWEQSKLSTIQFNIRPARVWSSDCGYSNTVQRNSDVYVFCLYTETDKAKADPLVLDGWDFYILPTKRINTLCGPQKTISLPSLLTLEPFKTDFSGLKAAVLTAFFAD